MAYDVLIKGGRVIDPASETDRPLDVAIQGVRIAKVTADISRRAVSGRCDRNVAE